MIDKWDIEKLEHWLELAKSEGTDAVKIAAGDQPQTWEVKVTEPIKDPVAVKGWTRVLTSPSVDGEGCDPHRIVLWMRRGRPDEQKFGTHQEVLRPEGTADLHHGHYDLSLEEALGDFEARVKLL